MLQLLFGFGFGFGAALIAFGLFYKRLGHVLEQRPVKPVQAVEHDALEELDFLKDDLQQSDYEIVHLQAALDQANSKVAALQAYIEQMLEIPGYAIRVRQNERAETARKLYAAGWSKRRIVVHLWGTVGGFQYKRLEGMLSTSSVTKSVIGTEIVPVVKRG